MSDAPPVDPIEQVFCVAIELPPEQRAAYLSANCPDAAIRAEVESLLAHAAADGILDQRMVITPHHADTARPDATDSAPPPESIIGPYRLLSRLGEGGFGVVYLAEQTEPVCRRVALKIVKPGMDSRQIVARFELERQALAMMDHPNVARVLDAGTTPLGRPYFVMEHVDGVPITTYCDNHCIGTRKRLELFAQVCEAVQHAHQKGIIHRDLKPSNVLLSAPGGRPTPKVIDFGVAKAIHAEHSDHTVYTEQGQLIGTPAFMSPEQADASGMSVDTRTDIYSLGVLLYVLLVGEPPFADDSFRNMGPADLQRIIREVEPPRPSMRLGSDAARRECVARQHGMQPAALQRQLAGDLDWITMKAMDKERARRYATAAELADDVRRYLSHQAIRARPPSAVYRASRFARRHRPIVVAAASILVALSAGLAIALVSWRAESVQRQRASDSERRANAAAHRAGVVSGFMRSVLTGVDPARARGREITARELLDAAAARVSNGDFAKQPDVDAEVRSLLGEMYLAIGELTTAATHLLAAIRMDRTTGARDPRDAAATLFTLGRVREAENDRQAAARHYGEAIARMEQSTAPDPASMAAYRTYLIRVRDQGLSVAEGSAILKSMHASTAAATARTDTSQQLLERAGRLIMSGDKASQADMAAFVDEGMKYLESRDGADHPMLLKLMVERAGSLRGRGKVDQALIMATKARDGLLRVHGDRHHEVAAAWHTLGLIHRDRNDGPAALDAMNRAYIIRSEVLGETNSLTTRSLHELARIQASREDHASAESLNRKALELRQRAPELEPLDIAESLCAIADCLSAQSRPTEAAPLYTESLAHYRRQSAERSLAAARVHEGFGQCLMNQDNLAEAEAQWQICLNIRDARLAADDVRRTSIAKRLADLYDRMGQPQRAAQYRATASQPSSNRRDD